jgi:RNA polymerase sigma-B factor
MSPPTTAVAGPSFFEVGRSVPARESDEGLLDRYAHGDMDARERLAARHMPMARRLAARHSNSSEPREDLEQVAYLGLLKTIDRYDPDVGSFIGYAVNTIRGELKRHFRDHGWALHVTRPVQERHLKVSRALESLATSLGRSPTPRDVAKKTGLTLDEVIEAMDAAHGYAPPSLDAPISPSDGESRALGDAIGSEDRGFEYVELRQAIGPVFRELPPREREILRLRFTQDLTQSEIGERMGISQMHVSRLLRRSVQQMSRELDVAT